MIRTWFSRPLWQRVAVAFALGILAGALVGDKATVWFKPLGDVYLNLVRMVVIPLVFFTIASSVARLAEAGNAARLGVRTLVWFALTSAIAVLVGFAFGHLVDPGTGLANLPLGEVKPRTIPTPLEVLIGMIPTNPIKAMADGNVLQVLVFAGIVGAALVRSARRRPASAASSIRGRRSSSASPSGCCSSRPSAPSASSPGWWDATGSPRSPRSRSSSSPCTSPACSTSSWSMAVS
jgi:Na+/H+-dicarboxylate symporter